MQKRKIVLGLAVAVGLAAASGYWKVTQFAEKPLLIKETTYYTLPARTGRVALETQLEQQNIIPKSHWFGWLLKLEPQLARFKAGTYRLAPNMTVRQLLALLASGKEAQFPMRFVEGQRFNDWLAALRKSPWIKHELTDDKPETVAKALDISVDDLEGAFYPDTYLYTAQRSDISLLKLAHQRMQHYVQQVWEGRDKDLPYKDIHQLVTMASLIEKETAVNEERARVASVFINRLNKGMKLQTDPTVIYGMGSNYKGQLTRKDLLTPTPYNTYVITGLPPGPIAIPSPASLQAAAHPEKTDFLYFVANGKGGHTFTTNLNSHNQAVQVWRAVESERKNKLNSTDAESAKTESVKTESTMAKPDNTEQANSADKAKDKPKDANEK